MKFTHQHSDGTKIEIEMAEHASMDAVLEEFQNFLRACGYTIEYNQCLVLDNMDENVQILTEAVESNSYDP
mgnify:FL=1|tara:strand:- start:2258 stop:2470 length:213 start_codon:yes stop_codon:yes gene_type:complete